MATGAAITHPDYTEHAEPDSTISPMEGAIMKLYHGSDRAIAQPDASRNTGFADLGRGFYLTDDLATARWRAVARARKTEAIEGMVSEFEFDENVLPWATWGKEGPAMPVAEAWNAGSPFGLRFDASLAGIAAWARFIRSCRRGSTAAGDLGEPSVVRAWIATEEVEMVCAGFAPAEALAEYIDPAQLIVQYCFRDQEAIDNLLRFTSAERIENEIVPFSKPTALMKP